MKKIVQFLKKVWKSIFHKEEVKRTTPKGGSGGKIVPQQ